MRNVLRRNATRPNFRGDHNMTRIVTSMATNTMGCSTLSVAPPPYLQCMSDSPATQLEGTPLRQFHITTNKERQFQPNLVRVLDEFLVSALLLDLSPELGRLRTQSLGDAQRYREKRKHRPSDKCRLHHKILLYAGVSMITI